MCQQEIETPFKLSPCVQGAVGIKRWTRRHFSRADMKSGRNTCYHKSETKVNQGFSGVLPTVFAKGCKNFAQGKVKLWSTSSNFVSVSSQNVRYSKNSGAVEEIIPDIMDLLAQYYPNHKGRTGFSQINLIFPTDWSSCQTATDPVQPMCEMTDCKWT